MRWMATLVLVSCLAARVLAGSVQEASLLLDQAYGPRESVTSPGNSSLATFAAARPQGLGVRYGLELGGFPVGDVALAAGVDFTWHPPYRTRLMASGAAAGNYQYQYWALGTHAATVTALNLFAGVDLRSEKLSLDPVSGAGGSTRLVRLWIKGGVGYLFGLAPIRPFFRLEAAAPLSRQTDGSLGSGDDARRALAPRYQVAFNAGIRF